MLSSLLKHLAVSLAMLTLAGSVAFLSGCGCHHESACAPSCTTYPSETVTVAPIQQPINASATTVTTQQQSPVSDPESSAAGEFETRVIGPKIAAWASGTISRIDDNGSLIVSAMPLPMASVHAQMRQEMHQKLATAEDPQQWLNTVSQVKAEWQNKLAAAAQEARPAEQKFTFKQPSDAKELVILDGKSVRDLPFFQRLAAARERREKAGVGLDEVAFVELYKVHEARVAARAEAPQFVSYQREKRLGVAEERLQARVLAAREKLESARLSPSDLKVGDKIFVGYDPKSDTAFSIIRREPER